MKIKALRRVNTTFQYRQIIGISTSKGIKGFHEHEGCGNSESRENFKHIFILTKHNTTGICDP